jgi:hypothetical protein
MRVRIMPVDQGGCAYFRQREPGRVAGLEGWDVTLDGKFSLGHDPYGRLVPLTVHDHGEGIECRPIQADVVVLQRPGKATLLQLIEAFQQMGTAVVVDVDDDFGALRHDHPARAAFHVAQRHVARACAAADLVTATTPRLAERYGAHGRVAVLPNCVPEAMLELPRVSDGRTLGWAGAAAVHPGDLEVTDGAVPDALAATDWRFQVVGPGEQVAQRLRMASVDATGFIESMAAYQAALGVLDVGIVPLEDSRFNRAKSYLKGLEYAARGVPFVASPRPEYERLAEQGVGLVAKDRARNWRSQLTQLMGDESLRCEMAARGRQVVADAHTIEGQGWRWLEAWSHAVDRRRGRGARAA